MNPLKTILVDARATRARVVLHPDRVRRVHSRSLFRTTSRTIGPLGYLTVVALFLTRNSRYALRARVPR